MATRKWKATCVPGVRFLVGRAGLALPEVLFLPTAHSGPGLWPAPPSGLLWFWHMFRPDQVWRLKVNPTPVGEQGGWEWLSRQPGLLEPAIHLGCRWSG